MFKIQWNKPPLIPVIFCCPQSIYIALFYPLIIRVKSNMLFFNICLLVAVMNRFTSNTCWKKFAAERYQLKIFFGCNINSERVSWVWSTVNSYSSKHKVVWEMWQLCLASFMLLDLSSIGKKKIRANKIKKMVQK